MQPRFDAERNIYRDCKWCGGKGCMCCKSEAEKEYKRQFPDGPKPIATFRRDDPEAMAILGNLLSQTGLESVFAESERRAEVAVDERPFVVGLIQAPSDREEAVQLISSELFHDVLAERLADAGRGAT